VAWYRDVLELELLDGPRELDAEQSSTGNILRDVFGADFRRAQVAQLGLDGDVGLELFEFLEPRTLQDAPASYFRGGFSHVCFTVADIEGAVERIRAAGGRIRTRIWRERPDRPYRFVHFEDPFGNLLELHSHGNWETVTGVALG
jgi:catechol 2,3-dioxygenase-like lactoylglutathione lyase family enzyme